MRVDILTTTATGPTADHIATGPGDQVLSVTWAGSPGSTRIQHRGLGSTLPWIDLKSPSDEDLDITANAAYRVPGNTEYRLNVTTHTSAATLAARSVDER
jgi:hypothetical protein